MQENKKPGLTISAVVTYPFVLFSDSAIAGMIHAEQMWRQSQPNLRVSMSDEVLDLYGRVTGCDSS